MQIGDTVKVKATCRYAADFPGEFIVIGMRLLSLGTVDVTISENIKSRSGEWLSPTDGFSMDELEVIKQKATELVD